MLASRDLRSGPGHALTALWCSVATAVWTAAWTHIVAMPPSAPGLYARQRENGIVFYPSEVHQGGYVALLRKASAA